MTRLTVRGPSRDGPSKLGPLVAHSKSDASTCPPSCPLMGAGCYGENFPLVMHWRRVTGSWEDGLAAIAALPPRTPFRHNVVGDLPGTGEAVDPIALAQLSDACAHLLAWTYTHKRNVPVGISGIIINASCDSLADADAALDAGHPAVVARPVGAPLRGERTPAGLPVYTCPAAMPGSDTTCSSCENGSPLCARRDRLYVIAFPAHGSRKGEV